MMDVSHREKCIDALKSLGETLGDDAELLIPDLIEDYYAQAQKLMADCRMALEEGRTADLRRFAHTLKSNSTTFGVERLAQFALQLENLARDGVTEGAAELIEQCEAEFPAAREALEEARKLL